MAMLHLLKIRTSIDIFKNEKCKVTFGLEYIYPSCMTVFYSFSEWDIIMRLGLIKHSNSSSCSSVVLSLSCYFNNQNDNLDTSHR